MQRPSPNFRSAEYFVYEIFKRFTQIYRNLFGDTMLVMPIQMRSNMADGNPRGGALGYFLGLVCAARDSKLAPRSKKISPKIDTPF